jgi:glutathione S-transferase
MKDTIDLLASVGASSIRSWRGTSASKTVEQPAKNLILFDQEACPNCRFVREALTELNLNTMVVPCPEGGKSIQKLNEESGSSELPRLFDPNTDENILGRDNIIRYLYKEYRGSVMPTKLENTLFNNLASKLASTIRLNAGKKYIPAKAPKHPLTLYSFESSPYSRIVRERLCELELPYLLVNLGKQQWSDMGPASFRLSLKPYQPIKNTKRDSFFKKHGNVQVPFLIDPNTGVELFESLEIVKYLDKTYKK